MHIPKRKYAGFLCSCLVEPKEASERRRRKVSVPAAYKEIDCCVVPQRKMRYCDQDEELNHLVAEYEQLCPGGLDEGAIEEDDAVHAAEQPAGSAVDTTAEATETTAAEE